MIGHGAAMALKERLLDESDKVQEYVCAHCGMIAMLDRKSNSTRCLACGSETDIYPVEMSYAFKLVARRDEEHGYSAQTEIRGRGVGGESCQAQKELEKLNSAALPERDQDHECEEDHLG